jgi:hypothetical protein
MSRVTLYMLHIYEVVSAKTDIFCVLYKKKNCAKIIHFPRHSFVFFTQSIKSVDFIWNFTCAQKTCLSTCEVIFLNFLTVWNMSPVLSFAFKRSLLVTGSLIQLYKRVHGRNHLVVGTVSQESKLGECASQNRGSSSWSHPIQKE